MKKLSNGTEVPARIYYYLLDYLDENRFVLDEFEKESLYLLDIEQFYELFEIATDDDFKKANFNFKRS